MKLNDRYFAGGWRPELPGENVHLRTIDNEDGTGVFEEYDSEGGLVSSQDLVLPLPEPVVEEVPLEEQVVALTTVIEDIGAALGSLTTSSTSTATRTALLNVRAVIDAALGGQ